MNRAALILTFLFIAVIARAQISHGGQPRSWSTPLKEAVAGYSTAGVDISSLEAEDAITDQHKDIPWRFGVALPVQLNLQNSGTWSTLPNGDKIWRLAIASPGAISLNLNFKQFDIPPGADLFVYSADKSYFLGSFNNNNNKTGGEFATSLIPGNKIVLEYYEPARVAGQGIIEVKEIIHGYRSLFEKAKNYGDAGACNIDVVCDSALWWDEARAVVMILTSGNTRICSGTLINNARQDGTPYVLTANHCNAAPNSIFMFNYRSPSCKNPTSGPSNITLQGCTIRANFAPYDFFLVELNNIPPASYKVFYAGWSHDTMPSECATDIHHPRGDVAKISHEKDTLISSGYYAVGNTHWKVSDWDSGTTEPVSSGSPLFNAFHRVIGQLHGGNAACGNDLQDYFGKFATAWKGQADSSQQLAYWLDPDTTNITYMEGYDPAGAIDQYDAALLRISGISNYFCTDTLHLSAILRNRGYDTLTTLNVSYSVDGGSTVSSSWTGKLSPFHSERFSLNSTPVARGQHTIKMWVSAPNGNADQFNLNDTLIENFFSNDSNVSATLTFKTDNFGSESTWEIRGPANNILYTGGPYEDKVGGIIDVRNLCLWDDCFLLIVKDRFNDGTCCDFGQGFHLITNANGDTLGFNNKFQSARDSIPFCPADTCVLFVTASVQDATNGTSNDGSIDLNVNGSSAPYSYNWSNGSTTRNISGLAPGNYWVIITDSKGCTDSLNLNVGVLGSVSQFTNLSDVHIFPNPASEYLYVDNSGNHNMKVDINIYALPGQLIYHENRMIHGNGRETIFLPHMDPQMVVVEIKMENTSKYQKILVR